MTRTNLTFGLICTIALVAAPAGALDGDASNTDLLAREFRGQALRVVRVGDVAFAALDSGIDVIDLGDPSLPRRLAHVYLPSEARDLAHAAGLLYVAGGESGLFILDVSNPSGSYVLGELPGFVARSIAVAPGRAFVGTGVETPGSAGALHVIDVSDPTAPANCGSIALTNGVNAIRFQSDRVFLALGSSLGNPTRGIAVVDVSSCAAPVGVAFLPTAEVPNDLSLAGDRLWVALSTGSVGAVRSVDVGDPAAPALSGHLALAAAATGIALDGNRAYVAATTLGLAVVDATSSASPTLVRTVTTGRRSTSVQAGAGLAIAGERGYIGPGGLSAFSLANPDLPQLRGLVPHSSIVDVAEDLGVTYVLARDALHILDTTLPDQPMEIGTLTPPAASFIALDLSGTLAALVEPAQTRLVDVTTPYSPAIVATIALPDSGVRPVLAGDTLYLVHQSGLLIFDVSDRRNPRQLASYYANLATDLAVVGGRGYLTAGADLHVLDLTRSDDPQLVDLLATTDFLQAVRVSGDHAFLGGLYDRLRSVDLSVSPPAEVATIAGGSVFGLAIQGNWLYAATAASGLEAYDLTYPMAPALGASYDTSGSAVRVAIQGVDVHVATRDGQLWTIHNRRAEPGCLATAAIAPAGPLTLCVGTGGELDASGSVVTGCSRAPAFAWHEDGNPIPGANSERYSIPAAHAAGSFTFGVTVGCPSVPSCTGSASIAVVVDPDLAPAVAANSVKGIKASDLPHFSWALGTGSGACNLHRTTAPAFLPDLWSNGLTLVTSSTTLTATDAAPPATGYYQVYGRRDCTGASAP